MDVGTSGMNVELISRGMRLVGRFICCVIEGYVQCADIILMTTGVNLMKVGVVTRRSVGWYLVRFVVLYVDFQGLRGITPDVQR